MKQKTETPKDRVQRENRLYQAILQLKTPEECRNFFTDLCTPAEIEALSDRWTVVGMLVRKAPYRAIAAKTGVSLATIGRVARFLYGDFKGYRTVLERLGEWKE